VDLKNALLTGHQSLPADDSGHALARDGAWIKKNRGAPVPGHGHDTRIAQAEMRTERAETRTELAKTRTEQAEIRTEQAETRTEKAETRTEQAETRTELAKTRTEQAEIRTEQAETRAERAETTLQCVVNREVDLRSTISTQFLKKIPLQTIADRKSPLEQLTSRQREVLQFIAEGQNTKQIAEILKISAKTVEFHRLKLMNSLDIHDVPGLVRFAMQAGLLPQEMPAKG
jgi:DNA-binding CsgD family transcriptional regulator